MAVPKKKISYSKTRKRFFSKHDVLTLYTQCSHCSQFIKLHCFCPVCFSKKSSLQQVNSNFKTNINKLYNNNI
jgi:ribosomal protein L32